MLNKEKKKIMKLESLGCLSALIIWWALFVAIVGVNVVYFGIFLSIITVALEAFIFLMIIAILLTIVKLFFDFRDKIRE
jgi:membrane protein YdbS with pleckstrin-like domain